MPLEVVDVELVCPTPTPLGSSPPEPLVKPGTFVDYPQAAARRVIVITKK
jgi:hypothetical protein